MRSTSISQGRARLGPVVRSYVTGQALAGRPSDALVRASLSEPHGTGAVRAYVDDADVWHHVDAGHEENVVRCVRANVLTVYVDMGSDPGHYSFLPIDIGFDPGLSGIAIDLPKDATSVTFADRAGRHSSATGSLDVLRAALERAGFTVRP